MAALAPALEQVDQPGRDGAGNTREIIGQITIEVLVSADNSSPSATPLSVPADGSSASVIKVIVRDTAGDIVTEVPAEFTTDLGALSAVTDQGNGVYTVELTSLFEVGTATVSISAAGEALTPVMIEFFAADGDGDGKGDVCDDDGFTCSAATTYQPLTTADYTADSAVLGVCLGCSVDDEGNAIDNMNATFAQINIGAALIYGGGYVKAVANNPAMDISDSMVGFVVSDPASQLLNLELLGNFTTIRFFDDGVEVDSATVGGGLLDLDLLGLGANSDQRFISAPAPAVAFDSIQLDYAGLVNANKSFRIHDICVGTP